MTFDSVSGTISLGGVVYCAEHYLPYRKPEGCPSCGFQYLMTAVRLA